MPLLSGQVISKVAVFFVVTLFMVKALLDVESQELGYKIAIIPLS
jgi:hypothetical protein